MTGFAIVTTTVGDADAAKAMARTLVEARLAACVQIVPVESVYVWEGAVETTREQLLTCKIAAVDFDLVATAICEQHSYDVPEIVMTPIVAGAKTYLDWIAAATKGRAPQNKDRYNAKRRRLGAPPLRGRPANRPEPET